jgi:hypothetical protein
VVVVLRCGGAVVARRLRCHTCSGEKITQANISAFSASSGIFGPNSASRKASWQTLQLWMTCTKGASLVHETLRRTGARLSALMRM